MFVFQQELNVSNFSTSLCRWGEEQKWHRLAAEETYYRAAIEITAYGCPLIVISSFKHLGWVLSESDDDWLVVNQNL